MTECRKTVQYTSLGGGLRERAMFRLFGLITRAAGSSRFPRVRDFVRLFPTIWLRPRLLGGLRILINPVDDSQTVIFDEIFLEDNYDLTKVPFEPSVIIDCGAHIGMFLLLAKARFPSARFIAYEPNYQNASLIRRQLSRNQLDIEFHEAAVSTRSSRSNFLAINSHGGRLSSSNRGDIQFAEFDEFTVDVLDFNAEIERLRPHSLLLKMDIEGEERDVLPAIMQALPVQTALFFETHFGDQGWEEMETLLRSWGFEVERINSRGLFCDGFALRA